MLFNGSYYAETDGAIRCCRIHSIGIVYFSFGIICGVIATPVDFESLRFSAGPIGSVSGSKDIHNHKVRRSRSTIHRHFHSCHKFLVDWLLVGQLRAVKHYHRWLNYLATNLLHYSYHCQKRLLNSCSLHYLPLRQIPILLKSEFCNRWTQCPDHRYSLEFL